MNDFLPTGYKVPEGVGNYMRFQDGENEMRILSTPIRGWEYWIDTADGKRKPVRKTEEEGIVFSEVPNPDEVKPFWAMVIWNYSAKRVQIMEITQKTIMHKLVMLSNSKMWGNPMGYDISIVKMGDGMETKYDVMPGNKGEVSAEIKDAYSKMKIDLNALYTGADPFAGNVSVPVSMVDKVLSKPVHPNDVPVDVKTAEVKTVVNPDDISF